VDDKKEYEDNDDLDGNLDREYKRTGMVIWKRNEMGIRNKNRVKIYIIKLDSLLKETKCLCL